MNRPVRTRASRTGLPALLWVPAGVVYTGAGIAFFIAWLRESERRTRRWERAFLN